MEVLAAKKSYHNRCFKNLENQETLPQLTVTGFAKRVSPKRISWNLFFLPMFSTSLQASSVNKCLPLKHQSTVSLLVPDPLQLSHL